MIYTPSHPSDDSSWRPFDVIDVLYDLLTLALVLPPFPPSSFHRSAVGCPGLGGSQEEVEHSLSVSHTLQASLVVLSLSYVLLGFRGQAGAANLQADSAVSKSSYKLAKQNIHNLLLSFSLSFSFGGNRLVVAVFLGNTQSNFRVPFLPLFTNAN